MNQITVTGSAWKPEIRTTQNGTLIFSVGIGVYDGKDQQGKTKYFTLQCKAFKEAAEAAGDAINERDNIIVTGRLSQETWTNKEGVKQYKTVLIADCIAKDTKQFVKKTNDPAGQFGQDVPEDDLPY